jgi:hypothetical protein
MYALIVFDISPQVTAKDVLQNFLQEIEKCNPNNVTSSKIFGSVWLIDLNNELSFLRNILGMADLHKIPYKVSFLESKPEFTT